MKKIFAILVFLGIGFAEQQNGIFSELGFGVGYYRYDEPGAMNTDELLLNLNTKLGYRYHFIKTEASGDFFATIGRYNGAILQFGEDELTQERKKLIAENASLFFDGQAKLGIELLSFSETMDLFLQSGIGYRYLLDLTTSYHRTQAYLYVPIELEGEIRSTDSFAWTYLLGYRHLIEGRHRTLIGALQVVDADYFAKQDKGFGAKLSFGWKKQDKDSLNFTRFVVDYWKIDAAPLGDTTTSYLGEKLKLHEPKNYTLSIYIQHGWRF